MWPCDHGPRVGPPPPILPAARTLLVQWPWPLFFSNDVDVPVTRPIVALIEPDASDRSSLHALLSSLDADIQDYDSAESYLQSRLGALACLIIDMALPGMSGLELLRLLRNQQLNAPVILLGEESDVSAAVSAMREGAVDFIEKPHLDVAIRRRVAYLLDHSVLH